MAFLGSNQMGLDERKPVFGGLQTTQAQTSLRSLISVFVICFLESIIRSLFTGKISIFYLVSVAKETGLKLDFSETLKTGFLATKPRYAL